MISTVLNNIEQKPSRNRYSVIFSVLVLFSLFFTGCGEKEKKQEQPVIAERNEPEVPVPSCEPTPNTFTFDLNGVQVDVKAPPGASKGVMLVLPGWNFSRTDWCDKSSLCSKALNNGYHLVLPEMGKSVYASQVYPETRKDWLKYKTGTWVRDTLIPYLQNEYCLLIEGGNNHVVGLSTGGRGAVLTAMYTPGLFKSCATLSGDFDQRLMDDDNLMTGWYGSFQQFQSRWGGKDNIIVNARKMTTPVLICHGRRDEVIGEEQALAFNQILEIDNLSLYRNLSLDEGFGHDYEYWNSRVDKILEFAEQTSKMLPSVTM